MPKRARICGNGPRRKKPRAPSEHHEQANLCRWLESKGLDHFAIPNERCLSGLPEILRHKILATLRARGMKKGIPDLGILAPGGLIFVELKKRGGEPPTAAQIAWGDRLREFGLRALVAYGCDDATQQISELLG